MLNICVIPLDDPDLSGCWPAGGGDYSELVPNSFWNSSRFIPVVALQVVEGYAMLGALVENPVEAFPALAG